MYVSSRRIYITKHLHLFVDCLNETRSFNVKFRVKAVCLTLLSKMSSNVVANQRYGTILLFLDRLKLDLLILNLFLPQIGGNVLVLKVSSS